MKRFISICALLFFTLPGAGAWGQNAPTYSRPTKAEFDALSAAASQVHSAAAAPTVNDDAADGYTAGKTVWFDSSAGQIYDLLDDTEGAAVWHMRGSNGAVVWLEHPGTGVAVPYPAASDSDAARGAAAEAALAAASSGDLIRVTGNIAVTSSLAKDGVNWWFAPGVDVSRNDGNLWDDGGSNMTFAVHGGRHSTSATEGYVVSITGASSSALFVVDSIYASGSDAAGLFLGSAGTLTVHAHDFVESDGYDGAWLDGTGTLTIYTPRLQGGDNAVEGPFSGGGNLIIHADRLIGSTECLNLYSATAFIKARYIYAVSLAIDAGGTASSVIECPTIVGAIQDYAGRIVGASINSGAVAGIPCITPPASGAITLENCTLTTHSGETYSVASSGNVNVVGELHADKPVHGSVTVTGGMVTVAGVVTQVGDGALPESVGGTGLSTRYRFIAQSSLAGTNVQSLTFGAWNTIDVNCLDEEVLDEGGAYTLSTATFTAPVDGYYKFQVILGVNGIESSRNLILSLLVNGSTRYHLASDIGSSGKIVAATSTRILHLSASDTVNLSVYNADTGNNRDTANASGTSYNYFSGELIKAD